MAKGKIDLSTGGNPYFSIDGGATNLANFASGAYTDFNGDGYQASHWKNGSGVGIMNPILGAGERKDISSLDLKAMDVIGWDIDTSGSDWQQMYDNAVQESETAAIQDRTKDVEKMIKESEYENRRPRRGRSGSTWQFGFWQFTTLDDVAASEIPELVESVPETDAAGTDSTSSPTDDTLEQEIVSSDEQPVESAPENTEGTDSTSLVIDDTLEQEILSSDEQPEEIESTILQPSDTSGLQAVSGDEQQQDPLLSGGITNEA